MRKVDQVSEFSAWLKEAHQVDVEVVELLELEQIWTESINRKQAAQLAIGDPELTAEMNAARADIGKAAGFIFGAILGAFFLPGLALASSWIVGAAIGGAIGYRLVGLFDQPQQQQQTPTRSAADPIFAFSGTGNLGKLGDPIPVIYCNSTTNPSGGIYRRDPIVIHSAIRSRQGSQRLIRLSLLAVGRLGSVITTSLQLDDQPLSNYNVGDVTVAVSSGLHNQPALSGITNYSQAVAINSNALLGISPAVITGGTDFNSWTLLPYTSSAALPAAYGGMVVVSADLTGSTTIDSLFCLNIAYQASPTATTANLAARVTATGWAVTALGAAVASGTATITAASVVIFRMLRSHPSNIAQLIIDNKEVWRTVTTLPTTVFGFLKAQGVGWVPAYPRYCAYTPVGDILPGFGTRFSLSDVGLSKLRSAQTYKAGLVYFSILGKDSSSKWIETNILLLLSDRVGVTTLISGTNFVKDSAQLATLYKAAIVTSKAVTSVDITIKASIWSINVNGEEAPHAQAFELWVEANSTSYSMGKFILVSAKQSPLLRTITIVNLPKAIYKIRVEPLAQDQIATSIRSLEEDSTISTVATGATIGGQAISIKTELGPLVSVANAQLWMDFAGKPQHGDQQGPSIQISHLNEMVDVAVAPSYPMHTIVRTEIIASDRIQSAPAESHFISQGQIIRNHLWAGKTINTGAANLIYGDTYISGEAPYPVGAIARILGKGMAVVTTASVHALFQYVTCERYSVTGVLTTATSSVITVPAANYPSILQWMPITGAGIPAGAVVIEKLGSNQLLIGDEWGREIDATTTGSITAVFNEYLPKAGGDRLVVYTMGSSNYFPDLYVDRLINPVTALGEYINGDYFIDYESIVAARLFCIKNNFFYDGVFAQGRFQEWAIATASSSLLFCTELDGRYALIPQEKGVPTYLFNASNTISYTEGGVPWEQQLTNMIAVKYQDNLGREKEVTIATTGLLSSGETEISKGVATQGVTSRDQAIKVGQVALKSIRTQVRTCQLKTDVAQGLYTRQGDIVRTQHAEIEYGSGESSGFVSAVFAVTNPRPLTTATNTVISAVDVYTLKLSGGHGMKEFVGSPNLPAANSSILVSGTASHNGNYSYSNIRLLGADRIYLAGVVTLNMIGATIATQKVFYNQQIQASEPISVSANSRVTIVHRTSRLVEADKTIVDLGNGLYQVIAIEEAIKFGDAFVLGTEVESFRTWRLTSISPDIDKNEVTLTGVQWDNSILDPAGTVVIDG
jgi:hypothetical protein